MFKAFYKRNKKFFKKYDSIITNNTVLIEGLVIAPVIVGANTFLNGLILAISFMVITFLTVFISSFIPKSIPYTIRVIMYTLIASLIFIPTAIILDKTFPEQIYKVGIFLPLMVTNSLIVTKSETRFFRESKIHMFLDLLNHTIGFFAVIIIVGAIRETLGNNTFMGNPVNIPFKLSILMLPYGGFVLVGFLSALIHKFNSYLKSPIKKEE